jgi:Fe-S cluster biosynthesis and repair protein YggX
MARMVQCVKLSREAEGLEKPPIPGELGQKIYDRVSKEAWEFWMAQMTMIINEYRLTLADPRAQQFLSEQMEKFFFGEGDQTPPDYVPPEARPS